MTSVASPMPMISKDLEGLYPPCLIALYNSTHAKTHMITDIITAVKGQNSAGTIKDSTKTVKIIPVIILCLNLFLAFLLG